MTKKVNKQLSINEPSELWSETQNNFKKLEKKLGGKVFSYFMNYNYEIHEDDVKYIYSHLKNMGYQKKLYFILYSGGGDGQSAWRIAAALRNYCDELIIVIPEIAASAATILSLAADKLIMTPLSYITAVDTSIYNDLNPRDNNNVPVYVSLDHLQRTIDTVMNSRPRKSDNLEMYETLFKYIHPLVFGDLKRTSNHSAMLCQDVLNLRKNNKLNKDTTKKLINKLNGGYPSHGYPILRHQARDLGLNIEYSDSELDDLLLDFLKNNIVLTNEKKVEKEKHKQTESIAKVIESVGIRYAKNIVEAKSLDETLKRWTTFKNENKWYAISEKQINGRKKIIKKDLNF